jgi:hypothetical protein
MPPPEYLSPRILWELWQARQLQRCDRVSVGLSSTTLTIDRLTDGIVIVRGNSLRGGIVER